jgi:putative GTP pyrophosphokinase
VGFRIVVQRATDQESLVHRIRLDDSWRIIDRRQNPSHGYRAVHVIRRGGEGTIEIQVRTFLQHQWAELSEIYDRVSPGVKYGGGAPELQETLGTMSETIAGIEQMELLIQQSQQHHDAMHKQMIVLLERAVRVASEVIEP